MDWILTEIGCCRWRVARRLTASHVKYGGQVDDVLEYLRRFPKRQPFNWQQLILRRIWTQAESLGEKESCELARELSQAHPVMALLTTGSRNQAELQVSTWKRFKVQFSESGFIREGNEQVEFYISANPARISNL